MDYRIRVFHNAQCTVEQRLYLEGAVGKIFFVKKYLIASLVFKLQKSFLHQNGVEFNKKSKSDLTKLWPVVGR